MDVKLFTYDGLVAGVDEAGRGPLAGPVFAAAVILPADFHHPWLNDSKKISEKKRLILRDFIIENALDWAIAMVDNQEIDRINILQAAIKAMHLALEKLKYQPDFIIVDGNKFKPFRNIPFKTVVHGDATYAQIAAASILAKVFRDEYMQNLAKEYPYYGWEKNKGYGTAQHRKAIEKYGLSPFHRKSFCQKFFQRKIEF
jgi:ribonuclease HII